MPSPRPSAMHVEAPAFSILVHQEGLALHLQAQHTHSLLRAHTPSLPLSGQVLLLDMPGLLLAKQISIILTSCCTVQMPLPFLHIFPAAMCRMQDGAGNSVSGSSTVIVNPPSQAIPCDTPSWPSTATFQCSNYGTADVSLIAI